MTNLAYSGTYKLHLTTVPHGTVPRRVKPVCGQSVRSSALSVVEQGSDQRWLDKAADPDSHVTTCKKCFG
jgi:hypothetical protein